MNILVAVADPSDAVSFYRGYGPLNRMRREMGLNFIHAGGAGWFQVQQADLVFIVRPCLDWHVQVIEMANDLRVPVVVDVDDHVFQIPPSNPAYGFHMAEDTKRRTLRCIRSADAVMVTTPELKRELDALGCSCTVVPNAYDHESFPYAEPIRDELRKLVVWRGSKTHLFDVASVREQLLQVMADHEDWGFAFLGHPPPFDLPDNGEFIPGDLIHGYHKRLFEMKPAIVHVPLVDDLFNRCKSNIAWIEATHAQAITLAPNLAEWDRPGVATYDTKDPADFRRQLTGLIRQVEGTDGVLWQRRVLARSREYIKDHLSLRKVNLLRQELFWRVMDGDRYRGDVRSDFRGGAGRAEAAARSSEREADDTDTGAVAGEGVCDAESVHAARPD